MLKNKVLVCGDDNQTSLGIVRELGSHGISFDFISIGKSTVVSKSRYCDLIVTVDGIDGCIQYLDDNYNSETYKPIIIISSDRLACYFDNEQDRLSSKYILPCTAQKGTLSYYTNKYNMIELAKELGLNCLKSEKINKSSSLEGLDFPCFIKPCVEKPGLYNEFKYRICKDKKALEKTLKYVRVDSEFVAQRCVKKEQELVVYGCRMRDGKTIISGVMFQDRFAESGFASHGLIQRTVPDYIDEKKIIRFIEKIGLFGPFDFEFAIEEGQAYYMETNFRCVGPVGFFNKSGASLVAAYVYSCAGLDYSNISCYVKQNNWCIDDIYDFENVLTGKISYSEWNNSMKRADLYRFYDEKDMQSYRAEKKRRVIKYIRDILVKKFRIYIVHFGSKLGLRK